MLANAPALTPISRSRPTRNPPVVAAKTKALTPRAAPTWRMNCWLVVALPMRATGTLFCTTTVSAGESIPMPAPETSAATTTHASPWANATMNKSSPRMCTTIPMTQGRTFSDPVHQSSRDEGQRAPTDGERAHYQADDRAVLNELGTMTAHVLW